MELVDDQNLRWKQYAVTSQASRANKRFTCWSAPKMNQTIGRVETHLDLCSRDWAHVICSWTHFTRPTPSRGSTTFPPDVARMNCRNSLCTLVYQVGDGAPTRSLKTQYESRRVFKLLAPTMSGSNQQASDKPTYKSTAPSCQELVRFAANPRAFRIASWSTFYLPGFSLFERSPALRPPATRRKLEVLTSHH